MDEATAAVATAGKPTKLRRNSKYAWACLWAIYLASVVGPICQFKVPPLAPWIIPAFGGMDSGTFGWLMGLMSVVGVVLAFPTVFIVKKMGLKGTILLAVGCLLAGSLVEIASGYMA
ncbi:MAG: hypothetical protein LBM21_02765, partial [Coriobacteriales bacterium]|nr:hypothetical protein [Coriobacteriales bacterium]